MHGRWYRLRDVAGALLACQGLLSKIMRVQRRHLQYHVGPNPALCLPIDTKSTILLGSRFGSSWGGIGINRPQRVQTSHLRWIEKRVCRQAYVSNPLMLVGLGKIGKQCGDRRHPIRKHENGVLPYTLVVHHSMPFTKIRVEKLYTAPQIPNKEPVDRERYFLIQSSRGANHLETNGWGIHNRWTHPGDPTFNQMIELDGIVDSHYSRTLA